MIPGSANPLLLADAGYQIQRSLRFRSSASASFSRTPNVVGNRKTWTWSGWVKRGTLADQQITAAGLISGTYNYSLVSFDSSHRLVFAHYPDTLSGWLTTTQVFRDPSSWYHLVAVFDSTNATSTNRMCLYVNGDRITSFTAGSFPTTYPALNADSFYNSTSYANHIGKSVVGGGPNTFDGYLSEVNFIDGQALTPASFGEISPVTGQWQAKKYAGTYGTNGFYLPFTDNSAATATAIGADKSGNGNNWTPNNISLTAGVTYDSMLDVPLGAGGTERGNYAVLNPLTANVSGTVVSGNLSLSQVAAAHAYALASLTCDIPTYAEMVVLNTTTAQNAAAIGIQNIVTPATGTQLAQFYANAASYFSLSGVSQWSAGNFVAGDIIQVAFDPLTGKFWLGKNNLWYNNTGATTGNPSAGTNQTTTLTTGVPYVLWYNTYANTVNINFGQRPFAYTPPTGFKALHTGNLPDPVIKQPAQYMAAKLFVGTAPTPQTISGLNFQPDFVWVKNRSYPEEHYLVDSVRGASNGLRSNNTAAEVNNSSVTAFTSDGFTVGAINAVGRAAGPDAVVAWAWKANGAAVSNTAGSITSQVSAGVAQGFSIVTYTGNGIKGATVGHGLGVSPSMLIIKKRVNNSATSTGNWLVLHKSVAATGSIANSSTFTLTDYANALLLNGTGAMFSYGYDNQVGGNTDTFVAYCFSEVAGYSKFGSYVGNGSADGPFVFCGFRPRFVMGKSTSAVGEWRIFDTARDPFNAAQSEIFANLSNAEATNVAYSTDILSNGFKPRNTNTGLNDAGVTYIFMAFAETPFKNSLAR